MNNIYMMMGVPGSGKSTLAKKNMTDDSIYISRDEIRFAMVSEDEEYFKQEKKVFKEFIRRIQSAMNTGKDIYVDATHLTKKSRAKILTKIINRTYQITVIYIKVNLETALKRNSNRRGREFVPVDVIKRMYSSIEEPVKGEEFISNYIVINNN